MKQQQQQKRHDLSVRATPAHADALRSSLCLRGPALAGEAAEWLLSAAGRAADGAGPCEAPRAQYSAAAMRRNGCFLHDGRASLNVFQVRTSPPDEGCSRSSLAVADGRKRPRSGLSWRCGCPSVFFCVQVATAILYALLLAGFFAVFAPMVRVPSEQANQHQRASYVYWLVLTVRRCEHRALASTWSRNPVQAQRRKLRVTSGTGQLHTAHTASTRTMSPASSAAVTMLGWPWWAGVLGSVSNVCFVSCKTDVRPAPPPHRRTKALRVGGWWRVVVVQVRHSALRTAALVGYGALAVAVVALNAVCTLTDPIERNLSRKLQYQKQGKAWSDSRDSQVLASRLSLLFRRRCLSVETSRAWRLGGERGGCVCV